MILVYNWKPPQRSPSIMKKITLKQSNHKVLALSAVFPSQHVSTVGCIVVTSQQGHPASWKRNNIKQSNHKLLASSAVPISTCQQSWLHCIRISTCQHSWCIVFTSNISMSHIWTAAHIPFSTLKTCRSDQIVFTCQNSIRSHYCSRSSSTFVLWSSHCC